MIAAGIDLGGTKSEVQLFDTDWVSVQRRRDETPDSYDALVALLAEQVAWAEGMGGAGLPIGIGAAGLIDADGVALTANLAATGRPFPTDIEARAKRPVTYVNDCRALALSEAVFGAGLGSSRVCALIIGTGIGGGLAIDGQLDEGPSKTGGEYGHIAASAPLIADHGLPIETCGCGRRGCVEAYIAGPGLARMASRAMGQDVTVEGLVAARGTDAKAQQVWDLWCALVADLMLTITRTSDPDCIVLGGGLSKIEGVVEDLSAALQVAQFNGFPIPDLRLAQGGDASGARGAALAAVLAHG